MSVLKKRFIMILVCILLIQSFTPIAYAATQSNKYISKYGAGISNPSNGVVRIDFNVYGTGLMSSIGASSIDLYENGSLVKCFSSTNPIYYSSMVSTSAYSKIGYVTYTANPGSTYYAVVSVFSSNSTGTGTETCTTGSITIPSP